MTWQRASELLESREYEQVARLLREQQEAVQRSGQMTLVIVLAAACQLCLTCRQFQADRQLHQIGLDKARRRERESRRQIQAVLTVLSQLSSPDDLANGEPLAVFETQTGVSVSPTSESEEQLTLLQKVKQLLGFDSTAAETAAGPSPSLEQPGAGSPISIDQEALGEQLQQFIASTLEGKEVAEISEAAVIEQTTEEEEGSEVGDIPAQPQAPDVEGGPVADPPVLRVVDEGTIEPTDKPAGMQARDEDEAIDPGDAHSEAYASPPDELTLSTSIQRRQPVVPHETTDLDRPSLAVYCLGPFQAYLNERAIEEWPSGKGKSIFKYLVNHRQRPAPKEVLMDLFWPDADPDAARNNLNVAIYGLRQAFRNGDTEISHVLYKNESYFLNPELDIWLDVEEFLDRLQNGTHLERAGFLSEAMREYHVAEALYQGEFLEEDRYEEWLLPLRRQLAEHYLKLLGRLSQYYFDKEEYTSCVTICRSMLSIDSCLEVIHRRLMRCHYRQGQHHLALRQYHRCTNVLQKELEVAPAPATNELYRKIRNHEAV